MTVSDDALIKVFLDPIRKCATYRPAFGTARGKGLNVDEFQRLYGDDVFYSWLGLDSPEMYAAHKAAGGITSVYRQVGVGSERLFRRVLASALGLSVTQMKWSYEYEKGKGKTGVHTLDARINRSDLEPSAQARMREWLVSAVGQVGGEAENATGVIGAAFEVRQGYKSADSKRQNADLRFGIHAYRAKLLPVFAIMSSQVSQQVIRRYRADGMLVLTGILDNDPTVSTFAFVEKIVGYDLPAFFERNSQIIRNEVTGVVGKLLEA